MSGAHNSVKFGDSKGSNDTFIQVDVTTAVYSEMLRESELAYAGVNYIPHSGTMNLATGLWRVCGAISFFACTLCVCVELTAASFWHVVHKENN
jgi:hypothetical protein